MAEITKYELLRLLSQNRNAQKILQEQEKELVKALDDGNETDKEAEK